MHNAHKSFNPTPYHLANSFKIVVTACKLAHAQAIGWALWCLWTMTALVLTYAFFLGIVTPLISSKRVSSRISSVRVSNSAIIRPVSHIIRSSFAHSQVSTRAICDTSADYRSQLVSSSSLKLSAVISACPYLCVF